MMPLKGMIQKRRGTSFWSDMHIHPWHNKRVLSHLVLGKSFPVADRVWSALIVNKETKMCFSYWKLERDIYCRFQVLCLWVSTSNSEDLRKHLRKIRGGPSVFVCNRKIRLHYISKIHHYQQSNRKKQPTFTHRGRKALLLLSTFLFDHCFGILQIDEIKKPLKEE